MNITLSGSARDITHGTSTSTRISRYVILLVCERTDQANGCTRSITRATHLVWSLNFGTMTALSSLCRPMGAWNPISITTGTRKLLVFTRIGNVNYLNLHPCRIVFVNGNLM